MAGRFVALFPRSGARFVGGALKPPTARPETLDGNVCSDTTHEQHSPQCKITCGPAQPPPSSLNTNPCALSPLSRFVETVRTKEWRSPRASLPTEGLLHGFLTSVPASPLLARVLRAKDPALSPQSLSPQQQQLGQGQGQGQGQPRVPSRTARVDEFLLRFEEQCLQFASAHRELKGVVDNMQGVLAARRGEEGEAVARFTLASKEENSSALFNLALAHQQGVGVDKDPTRALFYYRRAAAANHPAACLNLAAMLLDAHRGVEAAPWLQRAAELGNVEACITLALHLLAPRNDLGLITDTPRAISLLRRAAQAGSLEAERYLDVCAARGLCDPSPTPSPNPATTHNLSSTSSSSAHGTPTSPLSSKPAASQPVTLSSLPLFALTTRATRPKNTGGVPDRPRATRQAVRGDHRRAASR